MIAAANAAFAQDSAPSPSRRGAGAENDLRRGQGTYPETRIAAFWFGDVKDLGERLAHVKRGEVRTIAKCRERPAIYLVTYGKLERLEHNSNFNSAVGGRDLTAYMNKALRQKPVVYFVRAGPRPRNRRPHRPDESDRGDGDGPRPARQRPAATAKAGRAMPAADYSFRQSDGTAASSRGRSTAWSRSIFSSGAWAPGPTIASPSGPTRSGNTADRPEDRLHGLLLQRHRHQPHARRVLFPMSTEAPAILRVAMDEGPDLTVSLHSCAWDPAILRPAYMPVAIQKDVADVAARYYALLERRGLTHNKDSLAPKAEGEGKRPARSVQPH